jgi:PTH1 family peptidyl-tRNA hydrolase
MKVVIGLGNPGKRYAGTRHNVGFDVIDALAEGPDVGQPQERFQAEIREMLVGSEKVLLVAPLTFMNLSGRCVRQVVDFYHVALDDLLVVCDDVNLPLGKLRFRPRGSAGGHNGLRDIQRHLGTTEYQRLRIGVSAADEGELIEHVLGRFRPGERPVIEEAIRVAQQAVLVWVRDGIQKCMNEYNGERGA